MVGRVTIAERLERIAEVLGMVGETEADCIAVVVLVEDDDAPGAFSYRVVTSHDYVGDGINERMEEAAAEALADHVGFLTFDDDEVH